MPRYNLIIAALLAFAAPAVAASPEKEIHAVVNVDLMPSDQTAGQKLLAAYRDEARRDPAVRSILLIRQTGNASNHFILLETFANAPAYRRFVESPAVRHFRSALYPHLGSPWDERLGREA